jgi:hypothetical protein
MLVTMIGEISGSRDGVPWPPVGGVVDLPDDEAIRLVENRMAVPVVDPEYPVEAAVVNDPAVEKRAVVRKSLVK